jgi:Sulfotransferase domain
MGESAMIHGRTLPTLYLVGVPKAGTSAFSMFLAQHPQVCFARYKETNYYNRDFDLPRPQTEDEYFGLYQVTPETRALCEASVLNMYSREAAAAIARNTDDPRILMILRNPVDVMYSWHGQLVYTGNEPITDFRRALEAEPERKAGRLLPKAGTASRCPQLLYYRNFVRYAEQVERYFNMSKRENIIIFTYDEFMSNPLAVYQEVIRSLGLDDAFVPEFRIVNPAKVRRNPSVHYWMKRLLAGPARALLSYQFRLKLISIVDRVNTRELKRSALDTDLEEALKEECLPDVIRLGELIGRDLTHWCRVNQRS